MDVTEQDLAGSRFTRCNLAKAVLRGVYVAGIEIDAHDLTDGPITVNDVDVVPYVDAELNRRFPGRELRTADTPEGLREAWHAAEAAWAVAVLQAAGREDVSVDGEWSLAQTLRHLVMATNAWLHGAIQGRDRAFHPIGMPFAEYASEGGDMSTFREPESYDEVLAVRADHQAMVRDYLARVTPEELTEMRPNPWAPAHQDSVLHCLHTILNEEWEHLRFMVRDLGIEVV